MGAIGVRGLLAAALFGGILLGVQTERVGDPAGDPETSAPGPVWLRTTHGEADRPGDPRRPPSGVRVDEPQPTEPGLFQYTRLKLCVAYLGASRRDHADDHSRRLECAERTGVDLAALER